MTGTDLAEALPRATAVLQRGIDDGTQIGAQVYVARGGETVADGAIGVARDGVPMTPDSMMLWFSMTKAITAVAVAQQWERGALELDDPVAKHVPEFGANGKHAVTVRHCLTHTGGFRNADGIEQGLVWSDSRGETLARIYGAPLEHGWVPGGRAGYHLTAGMSILGEVVARTSGVPFDRYVRDEIFEPLGMHDCWVGMPAERYRDYGDRIGVMHDTSRGTARVVRGLDSEAVVGKPIPGGGGRGPMRQLARFYEMLRRRGSLDGVRVLSPQTVEAMSARHRVGMHDETFGIVIDWGLGLVIDHYGMGKHCSPRTFGHGGAQSSVAFHDPVHDVVVAYICNGMPGADRHHRRLDDVSSAIYVDLGLAAPDDPGRPKPYPTAGV
jgi:CubicO group peptidase (beta-lactamase class C family)